LKNYLKEYKENIYRVCKDEMEYLTNSKIEDRYEFINQVLKEFYDEQIINKFTYSYLINVILLILEYSTSFRLY
jgi:hypothetical protein